MRRRTALLATLLAAAATLLPAAGAQAAIPRSFFGLEAKDLFAFGQSYRDAEFPKVADAGVGLLRQEFIWTNIETSPGQYGFAAYDNLIRDAAKRGVEVMPILITTPPFRKKDPNGSEMSPPKNYADLGDFGAVVSHRYGPNGTFWAANPSVPKVPVRRFQIWNEPNIPRFWPDGPNAREYVDMAKAAVPRIRAADPGAEIVAAGISEPRNPCCVPLRTYLASMYAAGAAGVFDTIAVHPYWEDAAGVVNLVDAARQIMNDGGDRAASIRITEIGWATGGPHYSYSTDEAGQAARLRELYSTLIRRRCELKMRGVVWTMWRDHPPPEEWTQYTGLERTDGSAKPSYDAYREVSASNGPDCPSEGATTTAPGAGARDFIGVNAPELLASSSRLRDRNIRLQAKIGVGLLRQVFSWRSIERRRGRYSFGRYDRLVLAAGERGITLMPVITGAPRRYRSLRSRRSGMAKLASALARRYGPDGSLWKDHPGVARYPIRSWQIWQAPNSRSGWGGRPSARGYVSLLRAARRAIRRQDKAAEIVTAALASGRGRLSPLRFQSGMYRARGKTAFDVLAVTPFAGSARGAFRQVRAARRLMVRRGDRRSKLWVVSFGWADRGAKSKYRAGRKGQAARIRSFLRLLGRRRGSLALRGVIYVAWRDRASTGPAWTRFAGLLDSRRREKPAFRAFRAGIKPFR